MRWVGVVANRRSLAAAGLAFALWTIPIAAGAAFSGSTAGTTTFQSNVLNPPTGLSGICDTNNKGVHLTWTASTSAYATGYNVTWTAPFISGGSATVTPASSTSFTFQGTSNKLFTVQMTTYFQSWTSTAATATVQC